MKVSKKQLRRIIKEERARLLSEQPISGGQAAQMQSDEDRKEIEAEAQSTGDAAYDAIFDVVTEALNGSIGLGGMDDPHPAVYLAIVQALRSVADDVEVEMENMAAASDVQASMKNSAV